MQLHSGRENCLEKQCLELQGFMEQREGKSQQREAELRQTIRDKEELLQRYRCDFGSPLAIPLYSYIIQIMFSGLIQN